MDSDEWHAAPPMYVPRYFHACGTIKDKNGGNYKIVVAGGADSYNGKDVTLKSTEIFDGEKWYWGPDLPREMYGGQLVTSGENKNIFWLGGGDIDGDSKIIYNDIYVLSEHLDEWIKVPQKMNNGRLFFAAIDVPYIC